MTKKNIKICHILLWNVTNQKSQLVVWEVVVTHTAINTIFLPTPFIFRAAELRAAISHIYEKHR